MLELVSMFRPFSSWHFLLLVCLVDVTFILVHISQPPEVLEERQGHLDQARRLREALTVQGEVARSLEENGKRLRLLYQQASGKAKALQELERGMADLEHQIELLKANITTT